MSRPEEVDPGVTEADLPSEPVRVIRIGTGWRWHLFWAVVVLLFILPSRRQVTFSTAEGRLETWDYGPYSIWVDHESWRMEFEEPSDPAQRSVRGSLSVLWGAYSRSWRPDEDTTMWLWLFEARHR